MKCAICKINPPVAKLGRWLLCGDCDEKKYISKIQISELLGVSFHNINNNKYNRVPQCDLIIKSQQYWEVRNLKNFLHELKYYESEIIELDKMVTSEPWVKPTPVKKVTVRPNPDCFMCGDNETGVVKYKNRRICKSCSSQNYLTLIEISVKTGISPPKLNKIIPKPALSIMNRKFWKPEVLEVLNQEKPKKVVPIIKQSLTKACKLRITRYPNRRLYDCDISNYIVIDDLKNHVLNGVQFSVFSFDDGEDVTQEILFAILKDNNRLTSNDLITLIQQKGQPDKTKLLSILGNFKI